MTTDNQAQAATPTPVGNAKYEFVPGDTITAWDGATLHRIRAVAAITAIGVLPGHLGGYIEAEANLSVSGEARVSGEASKTPIFIGGLRWGVTVIDAHMQIGCQYHSLAAWGGFGNAEILNMDGRDALRFWQDHKALLLGIARANERSFDVPAEEVAP